MGSPRSEEGRFDNETEHPVILTNDFELQTTEVTQAQFEAVMGYNPSRFGGCSNCPVESINWYEAAAYCNALSDIASLPHCYDCSGEGTEVLCDPAADFETPYECDGYRLPTDAEWEYAVRAGSTDARYGDADDIAWYRDNSEEMTHEVAGLLPNDWGLYDMLGNVHEWCADGYHESLGTSLAIDPYGGDHGLSKVNRNSYYMSNLRGVRAARRYSDPPDRRGYWLGVRCARTLAL